MLEAAVLAAGEGRRLRPITNYYPKPLLPILSVPLLEYILLSLKEQGIGKVCINVCHLKSHIIDFIEHKDHGIEIVLSKEGRILGTGGGIGRMRRYIQGDDFIVHNGDIVTNVRFGEALAFHRRKRAVATLLVEEREGTKDVLMDEHRRIVDIAERVGGTGRAFGFTGVAILARSIFDHLPEKRYADMVSTYAALIAGGEAVYGYVSRGHYWIDIGTKERYLLVHRHILIDKIRFSDRVPPGETGVFVGEGSKVHAKAELSGFVSIGRNCSIGAGVHLTDCVVFDDTRLAERGSYDNSIISPACITRKDDKE